jgi:ATP-dependent RNA helicase DeaD
MTESSFSKFDISNKNVKALKKLDITDPTPVQEKAIPLILKGHNVMAQSKTGTGKTYAYLIPIIEQLTNERNQCLIIVPVRELAKQVKSFIQDLNDPNVKAMTIYGGVSINRQIQKLKKGVNIICGTPGRLIDLYKRGHLKLNDLKFVVLDEADRLLDMGFIPDIKYILNKIHSDYQFLLFSATLDYELKEIIKKYTKNEFKYLDLSKDDMSVGNTLQFYYMVDHYKQKYNCFREIIKRERPESALVFINTKRTGKWLFNRMKSDKGINRYYNVGYISGDLSQNQRERILKKFRQDKVNILIGTDVAARGFDIEDISHVINYDLPKYPEVYVHRIGRTSRMNKHGVAITLVVEDEYEYLCRIEGLINKEIRRKTLHHRKKRRNNRFPIRHM